MKDRAAIFILIDGLGWEYVKDHRFLDEVAVVKVPCRTVLGYSSSAIPTILSGKYPSQTGHGNYYYYSPETSLWKWTKRFSWLPLDRIPRIRGWIDRYLSAKSWQKKGYTGYFQHCAIPFKYRWLFDYNEKKSIFYDGLINGKSIFSHLRDMGLRFFLRTFPNSDQEILTGAIRSIEQRQYRFYFLYLSEMDGVLHEFCNVPSVINEKLAWYDQQIRRLFDVANRSFDQAQLYVFSDHGMTPVIGTFDLISEMEKECLKIPIDYVPFYDSTMARFWFFKEEARERVFGRLGNLTVGHVLSREELIGWGAYFPDRKFGEMIFLMNPGYVIVPSYISNSAPRGMHGFSPEDKWSDAMFMSSVVSENQPRSITDFYPIMLQEAHQILGEAA